MADVKPRPSFASVPPTGSSCPAADRQRVSCRR